MYKVQKIVKHFGFYIDTELKYRKKVKKLVIKLAEDIKCISALRNIVPQCYGKTILKALVISHVQYLSAILSSIDHNLLIILELGYKSLFQPKKLEFYSRLKSQKSIFPISRIFE